MYTVENQDLERIRCYRTGRPGGEEQGVREDSWHPSPFPRGGRQTVLQARVRGWRCDRGGVSPDSRQGVCLQKQLRHYDVLPNGKSEHLSINMKSIKEVSILLYEKG